MNSPGANYSIKNPTGQGGILRIKANSFWQKLQEMFFLFWKLIDVFPKFKKCEDE
jgi:hypothetical protein